MHKETTKNLLSKLEGCWQLKNKEEETNQSIAWGEIPIRKKSRVTDISSGTDEKMGEENKGWFKKMLHERRN